MRVALVERWQRHGVAMHGGGGDGGQVLCGVVGPVGGGGGGEAARRAGGGGRSLRAQEWSKKSWRWEVWRAIGVW